MRCCIQFFRWTCVRTFGVTSARPVPAKAHSALRDRPAAVRAAAIDPYQADGALRVTQTAGGPMCVHVVSPHACVVMADVTEIIAFHGTRFRSKATCRTRDRWFRSPSALPRSYRDWEASWHNRETANSCLVRAHGTRIVDANCCTRHPKASGCRGRQDAKKARTRGR